MNGGAAAKGGGKQSGNEQIKVQGETTHDQSIGLLGTAGSLVFAHCPLGVEQIGQNGYMDSDQENQAYNAVVVKRFQESVVQVGSNVGDFPSFHCPHELGGQIAVPDPGFLFDESDAGLPDFRSAGERAAGVVGVDVMRQRRNGCHQSRGHDSGPEQQPDAGRQFLLEHEKYESGNHAGDDSGLTKGKDHDQHAEHTDHFQPQPCLQGIQDQRYKQQTSGGF